MELACSVAGGLLMFAAGARTARQTLAAAVCPKRRDHGAHERGDRGRCLYCDLEVAATDAERWWCEHCDARVPSTDKLCSRCGRVPRWR